MEFPNMQWQPQTSEQSCMENTSPETLGQVITGFLQTVTGLPWEVRVERAEVENVGDFLKVRAMATMSVPKDRIGSEPDYKMEWKSGDGEDPGNTKAS